jgi:putative PEP-CTERM system TPR-repeat lipoprotein
MKFPPTSRFLLAPLFVALLSIGTMAMAADARASKYYEDALIRYEKKDLNGAVIQLKNALQIDKDMLPVQMLLGKALLQNGDVVAAEAAFKEALRLGVNREEIILPMGQAYMAQGKLREILEQQYFNPAGLPSNLRLQVLLLRAAVTADLGNVREALKIVEEARAIDPRAISVWLAEVPIRVRSLQFKEAAVAADRGLELGPEVADAWYQKGTVLHSTGDLRGALTSYDKALQIDPGRVDIRVARVGLYVDLGQESEADKEVKSLLETVPNEPGVVYLSALLAERANRPEEARIALKKIVNLLDPVPPNYLLYHPQLLMLNGLAHFGLNEREKAKQYLEFFQKVQGNSAATKILAQIYLSERNIDRAVEVLETYLKAQPSDGQAMVMLGSALMSKGQYARATALMQKGLENRDAPELRTVLGLSLIRGGQTRDGVVELEAAYKNDSGQTNAGPALITMYLGSGQAKKALSVAEDLVKKQPANARYHNMLGMAKGQTGNLAGAKTAFEQASKLDPSFVQPKLNLARLEIAEKAYDAAVTRLTAILKAEERNNEAMFEMATLSERRGQMAEAQRWLEKANDVAGPRDFRWALALSEFHLRSGHPIPALDAAKLASAKAPEELVVLIAYAKAQLANKDSAAAKSTLTSATKAAGYNPQRQVQVAVLQSAAGNLTGAAYCLDKALSTQPDFLPAMALMAEVELRQGDAVKAEKRARDIVTKHPKRAIGFSLLGDIAMVRADNVQAAENYRKAHLAEPSTETLLRLFKSLNRQDGRKNADQLAEQWLKVNPKDLQVQRAVADSYARAANLPMARAAYEKVLKIAPEDGAALNNLANVLLALKDPTAVKVAEQAVAKAPGSTAAIDTLGWALFKSGQPDKALPFLRDARLRQPSNPEVGFHLATVLAALGRKTEARAEVEDALKLGNNFEGIREARELLKSLSN